MKKVIKTIFITLCLVITLSSFSSTESVAKASKNNLELNSEKSEVSIIRIVEDGRTYICVIIDGLIIMKVEEL